jgi:hypothetical protein
MQAPAVAGLGVALCMTVQAAGEGSGIKTRQQEGSMNISLTIEGGESVTATLHDTVAARDFASLLPLILTLKDYASTEKVAELPKRLDTEGEPDGFAPSRGDITLYAPWGNLAIFYKDFTFSRGLVSLGKLSRVPDAFRRPGPVTVTIARR